MKRINFNNVKLQISAGRPEQFPASASPVVAFSGRSNVGKSTLINKFLGRKSLARVSSAPGKTVTVNFYDLDGALLLADLPGYGYAKRTPAERAALSRITDAFFTNNKQINRLKLVLQLIDSRVGINADDATMLDYLNSMQIPYCVVMTKTDKLNKTELEASYNDIASSPFLAEAAEIFGKDIEIVRFSALNGTGVERIKSLVIGACS
ncbi:MAG: ribosome biogenesis GTP-binding protein YsxC [Ruminococcaceae bacterium]|nr:ribosome biogenesis GTP-binding protein YsxC [Oscillospiraceae bacterium]